MSKGYRYEDYTLDLEFSLREIAAKLGDGTLVLFLGAGVSMSFGLPDWITFANVFRKAAGLRKIPAKATEKTIQNSLDQALDDIGDDDAKKIDLIRKALYEELPTLDVNDALNHKLLIAICGLLIGARRGHVRRVVTFNYDSMLEWFLSLFGFHVRSISDLPEDEGSEDVRIYHPHGFVPHPHLKAFTPGGSPIVGLADANLRASGDEWWVKERQLLETGTGLFIGLSYNAFSDRAFQPHIKKVSTLLGARRPVGFWVICDKTLPVTIRNDFLRYDVVPIHVPDRDALPGILLKICQYALEALN